MLVDFLVVVFVLVVVLVVVDGDVGDGVVFVEFVLDLVVAVSDMFLVADLEFVNKFIFLFMSVFVCPTVVLVVDVVVVVVVVVIEDTFSEELAMVLGKAANFWNLPDQWFTGKFTGKYLFTGTNR